MKKTISYLSLGAITLIAVASHAEAKRPKPIMQSANGEIIAVFDGPSCDATVSTVFHGKNTEDFLTEKAIASRLMTNVADLLQRQCSDMSLVKSKGIVDGKTVYSGLAQKETGWAVREIGARKNPLIGGDVQSDAEAKNKFKNANAFISYDTMLEKMGDNKFLCIDHDKSTDTCIGILEFGSMAKDSADIISHMMVDKSGSVSEIAYNAQNQDGFLCSKPAEIEITISGGNMNDAEKTEFVPMMKDRITANGSEICIGYKTFGDDIVTESFNEEGKQLSDFSTITITSTKKTLRRED